MIVPTESDRCSHCLQVTLTFLKHLGSEMAEEPNLWLGCLWSSEINLSGRYEKHCIWSHGIWVHISVNQFTTLGKLIDSFGTQFSSNRRGLVNYLTGFETWDLPGIPWNYMQFWGEHMYICAFPGLRVNSLPHSQRG